MNTTTHSESLVRDRRNRVVAGVCAGIAEYLGVDVTVVRALVGVLVVITGGTGALAYLAAWAIIPGEGEPGSIAENLISSKPGRSASR